MPLPYQVAAEALRAEMSRVEVISNNLVNAVTAGYRRAQLVSAPFAARLGSGDVQLAGASPAMTSSASTVTDFSQAALRQTGDPHHLALTSAGFFEVREGEQLLYSRGGVFQRDEGGRLINAHGQILQGEGGDVVLKSELFQIDRDGTVIEDGRAVTRLRVVDFANRAALLRSAGGSFDAATQSATPVKTESVRQGALEDSNVSSSTEMVQLMEALKHFEFGQRIVQSQDEMLDRSIRKLGDLQ